MGSGKHGVYCRKAEPKNRRGYNSRHREPSQQSRESKRAYPERHPKKQPLNAALVWRPDSVQGRPPTIKDCRGVIIITIHALAVNAGAFLRPKKGARL